jgi:hypothetical protein
MLVEKHLARWGMTTRETRTPGGKDMYKALASDVVSYFNRLKGGPKNLPLVSASSRAIMADELIAGIHGVPESRRQVGHPGDEDMRLRSCFGDAR